MRVSTLIALLGSTVSLVAAQPTGQSTILQTLANNASTEYRFSNFSGLVQRLSDVGDQLKGTNNQKRVVFAPTDEAFSKLNSSDPAAYAALLNNNGLLSNILKYHILNEDQIYDPTAVTSKYRGFYKTELGGGQVIRADVTPSETTLSNGVNSTKVLGAVPASDGTIYPIGEIIVPPYSASRVIASESSLSELQSLIQQVNYNDTLNSLQYVTIFAPNNDAISALRGSGTMLSTAVITSAINLHIVPRVVYSTHIIPNPGTGSPVNGPVQAPTALENVPITVTSDGKDIFLAGPGNQSPAKVVESDILFAGGVIHIIDKVLLPKVNPDGTVPGQGGNQPTPTTPVSPKLADDNRAKGPIAGGGDVNNVKDVKDGNQLTGLNSQSSSGAVATLKSPLPVMLIVTLVFVALL